MKDENDISSIGFLVDSALSNRHNVATGSSPMLTTQTKGDKIFFFQIFVAMMLTLIVNAESYSIVQYDEESAW